VEFASDGRFGTDELSRIPEVSRVDLEAGGYRLTTAEPHRTIPALLLLLQERGAEITALNTHQATLDDVFLAQTGRQLRDG
jgi:ABC-2 type transport system ATP-binding protein